MKKLLASLAVILFATQANAETTILCKYETGMHVENGKLQSYPTTGSFSLSFNDSFVIKTSRSCINEVDNFVTEEAIIYECLRGEIDANLQITRLDGRFYEKNGIFQFWGSCSKKLKEF